MRHKKWAEINEAYIQKPRHKQTEIMLSRKRQREYMIPMMTFGSRKFSSLKQKHEDLSTSWQKWPWLQQYEHFSIYFLKFWKSYFNQILCIWLFFFKGHNYNLSVQHLKSWVIWNLRFFWSWCSKIRHIWFDLNFDLQSPLVPDV